MRAHGRRACVAVGAAIACAVGAAEAAAQSYGVPADNPFVGTAGAPRGGGGDPLGNGQNLGTLLGKLIRIDPRAP